MTYPKEILIKRVDEVPENVRELFFSTEKSDKLEQITKELGLSQEIWVKIERAVNIIILCIQPLSTFRSLLMGDVGLSYDQAVKTAAQINEKVFAPVMADLKKFEDNPHIYDAVPTETENEDAAGEQEEMEDAANQNSHAMVENLAPSTPISPKDHLLPTHETMEKASGSHMHTQTVVPASAATQPATPIISLNMSSAPARAPISSGQPSIVDQKLRGLVRPNREETVIRDDVEKRRKIVYKDADPYREPLQ